MRGIKPALKASPLWPIIKYAAPRYHRPLGRLALARLQAGLFPGPASRAGLARAYVELAWLKIYENDLPAAAAACDQALAHDPALTETAQGKRAEAHVTLGGALMSDFDVPANLTEAARHFDIALRLEPRRPEYYEAAGLVYRYSGQSAKAEELWSRGAAVRGELARLRGLDRLGARFLGPSWFASFGHAACLDFYFKMTELCGRRSQKTFVIAKPGSPVREQTLLNLWKPRVEIVESASAAGVTDEEAGLLQDDFWALQTPGGKTRWYMGAWLEIQKHWDAENRPPLLQLSAEERARGRGFLKELGVPADAWFVCLHVREEGYWGRLDRKHPNARSCDVETYLDAVRAITRRGGWVVRIGDPTMKPLPAMERVIDFARDPRKTEWMDVFLCAESRFFLGTASGPASIPPIFGVPCALTNWIPIGAQLPYRDIVTIPKLCRSRRDGRALTVEEVFEAGLGHLQEYRHLYEERGVTPEDNTPEEIAALALEMLDRAEGRAVYSAADEELQERFRETVAARGGVMLGRVGRDFLRRHDRLLPAVPA